MPSEPDPEEIFDRAVDEGARRLDQSLLELISTSFIAGFTIVFGIVALGIVEAHVAAHFEELAKIAGSLAFGFGVVFLVIGRTELFNENFFDPVATAVDRSGTWLLTPLLRLWSVTFVFNLVGGVLFVLVFAVDGVLTARSIHALESIATETVHRTSLVTFADAIVGGALVAMLSFLLQSVDTAVGRILLAYIVGFLLALGPFDHVIVTALHVFFGIATGADIGYWAMGVTTVVATAGNIVGGLGLVTLTHITQVKGARQSNGSADSQ